jgi:hypothetical protein
MHYFTNHFIVHKDYQGHMQDAKPSDSGLISHRKLMKNKSSTILFGMLLTALPALCSLRETYPRATTMRHFSHAHIDHAISSHEEREGITYVKEDNGI